jgi:branched-chain amino acid transport system substrate-binding protein
MAVDEFNPKGGLNGRKIEIMTRDDKFKADEALAHARELVLKENVDEPPNTDNPLLAMQNVILTGHSAPFFVYSTQPKRGDRYCRNWG